MRLFLNTESSFPSIVENTTGFYRNYRWWDLPPESLPLAFLERRNELFVLLNKLQLEEISIIIHEECRMFYVVPKNVIKQHCDQLEDMLAENNVLSLPLPNLEDPELIHTLARNFDVITVDALWKFRDTFGNLNIQGAIDLTKGGKEPPDPSLIDYLNQLEAISKFYIRHNTTTARWSDTVIEMFWKEIVEKILALVVKEKPIIKEPFDGLDIDKACEEQSRPTRRTERNNLTHTIKTILFGPK